MLSTTRNWSTCVCYYFQTNKRTKTTWFLRLSRHLDGNWAKHRLWFSMHFYSAVAGDIIGRKTTFTKWVYDDRIKPGRKTIIHTFRICKVSAFLDGKCKTEGGAKRSAGRDAINKTTERGLFIVRKANGPEKNSYIFENIC